MPVPQEYQRATDEFYDFLKDARDTAGLESTHQAYTMTQGVLWAFRRRLEFEDAIRFAAVLPAVLRAIFVADWDIDEPKRPFGSREDILGEVQATRARHNFAPDTAIADVATALRRHVDEDAFDRLLAELPAGAAEFWRVE
jgi:uncharacterized protein (DUF2267 family)